MATFDLRSGLRWGGAVGVTMMFVCVIGMVETFDGTRKIVSSSPSMGVSMGFVLLLAVVPFLAYRATVRPVLEGVEPLPAGIGNVLTGLVVAGTGGGMLAVFTWWFTSFDIRFTFTKLSPTLGNILTFQRAYEDVGSGLRASSASLWPGILMMFGVVLLLGLVGGLVHMVSGRMLKRIVSVAVWVPVLALLERIMTQIMIQDVDFSLGIGSRRLELGIDSLFERVTGTAMSRVFYTDGGLTWGAALFVVVPLALWYGGREKKPGEASKLRARLTSTDRKVRTRWSLIVGGILLVIVILGPQFLGPLLSELLANVSLFLLMALGLNIVVGLTGMLDLGYVAFFAVGAYTSGLLTSRLFDFQWSFWQALPVALVMSAISGILVGTPVIRMRGDYLAIVTLGFGEMVRLMFLSDLFRPTFGGSQGITKIAAIPVGFGKEVSGINPQALIYLILVFVAIAIWISYSVQKSRIGRAWTAIREDESVAEVMGIHTVNAKLSAFVMGAILAGMGGAIFAAKVGGIFPNSFQLLVSIIILVIVIVGGMGSIRGMVVGSLVLIGVLGGPTQPGLLAEFAQYKLLVVGLLLIFMMLKRPEGLAPNVRRSQELHHEEIEQDVWLKAETGKGESAGETT